MSSTTLSPCHCAFPEPHCTDSRQQCEYRRRRYKCSRCGLRWTTVEIIVSNGLAKGRAGRGSARDAAIRKFSADEGKLLRSLKAKLLILANEAWPD